MALASTFREMLASLDLLLVCPLRYILSVKTVLCFDLVIAKEKVAAV